MRQIVKRHETGDGDGDGDGQYANGNGQNGNWKMRNAKCQCAEEAGKWENWQAAAGVKSAATCRNRNRNRNPNRNHNPKGAEGWTCPCPRPSPCRSPMFMSDPPTTYQLPLLIMQGLCSVKKGCLN